MKKSIEIKNKNRIDFLYDFLKPTDIITVFETGEEMALADFDYFYDGQKVTIQWEI
jgi:hypothetical protein